MFPKNAWYVACSSDEVTDAPLGRTICNERLVIYRDSAGSAVALEDLCPHRRRRRQAGLRLPRA